MPTPQQPELIICVSPMQASAATGINAEYIYQALRERTLTAYKVGAKRKILVRDLLLWIESFPKAAPPKPKKKRNVPL
jgi:excisionase family DNA binding protein